jgi:hypothetical protein
MKNSSPQLSHLSVPISWKPIVFSPLRVEGLANFGKPTGEFETVEQTNEDDALIKWDDDGRMRLRQPWLKKVSKKSHPLGRAANV